MEAVTINNQEEQTNVQNIINILDQYKYHIIFGVIFLIIFFFVVLYKVKYQKSYFSTRKYDFL
jgi:hypothetical protein